ncbi:MAG: hypothetical protein ACLTSU_02430 [Acutalibacteraceae bacterium]
MEYKPVTAIIVGAGHRSMVYSKLALTNPELLKIVGVADPDPHSAQKVPRALRIRRGYVL